MGSTKPHALAAVFRMHSCIGEPMGRHGWYVTTVISDAVPNCRRVAKPLISTLTHCLERKHLHKSSHRGSVNDLTTCSLVWCLVWLAVWVKLQCRFSLRTAALLTLPVLMWAIATAIKKPIKVPSSGDGDGGRWAFGDVGGCDNGFGILCVFIGWTTKVDLSFFFWIIAIRSHSSITWCSLMLGSSKSFDNSRVRIHGWLKIASEYRATKLVFYQGPEVESFAFSVDMTTKGDKIVCLLFGHLKRALNRDDFWLKVFLSVWTIESLVLPELCSWCNEHVQ